MGLTVFMVTHDLDSLYTACDRIAALGDGQIIAEGPIDAMLASDHPWLRSYFHGKRARSIVVPEMSPTSGAVSSPGLAGGRLMCAPAPAGRPASLTLRDEAMPLGPLPGLPSCPSPRTRTETVKAWKPAPTTS